MYKVLVVDDEPIAVESVNYVLRENFGGVFEAVSCNSGKQAIARAAELFPDIVIMDIDMPGINGLDAIKKIRESQKGVEFVIISAFDYFDYAQEAVSLGVAEYLVKPVKEEKLCSVLNSILTRRRERQTEKQHALEQQERLMMSIPVLETSFCNALSSFGEYTDDLENTCALLGHRDVGGYAALFSLAAGDGAAARETQAEAFRHRLKRLADCVAGQKKDCVAAYIFAEEAGNWREQAEKMVRGLVKGAETGGLTLLAGIGRRYDSVSEGARSYQEARTALRVLRDRNSGKSAALYLDDFAREAAVRVKDGPHYMEELLYTGMERGDAQTVAHELVRFIEGGQGGGRDFAAVKKRVADIEVGFGRRFNVPVEDTRVTVEEILKAEERAALVEIMRDSVTRTAAILEGRKQEKATSIVEKAENYILEHYAEPITLEDVAGAVNLSQHYFSRSFKQGKGVGFADYLSKVRIDHAKKLLIVDGLSVKEIAYMVGFADPNYFSKTFKKLTGHTPGDYKNSREKDAQT